MKRAYSPLVLCCFLLITSSCRSDNSQLSKQASTQPSQEAKQEKAALDPCARYDPLRDPDNEELRERFFAKALIEEKGYPKDITVAEAIEMFNQDAKCHHIGKTQPPLTEAEFLTTVYDIPGEDTKPSALEKKYLTRVFEKKILPKGARIDHDFGYDVADGHKVRNWKIYLRFDLHTHPIVPDDLINRKDVRHNFTIRRQYISTERSQ